ncbi:hypothetical protein RHM62_07190 [Actimicrobium sp. CCC2.4]|uniref:hypothetical protein n=2 Tax=Actimicrobium sp. CCC2.4 TaxID=3048606 RepID=UPI002AC9B615|nr:hypothetical protein [Actimicrobium sp. CCC2.4]WPX33604.1 hypothetical protein RHM62_07190 [Actimicrobium sp. CCC2.4]
MRTHSLHPALPSVRTARALPAGMANPPPLDQASQKNPDNRLPQRAGQLRSRQLRTALDATLRAKNTLTKPLPASPRQAELHRHTAHRTPDNPMAVARAARFFLDIVRTDTLSPDSQARELQAQARQLPQLSQTRQADAFRLMLAMTKRLPVDQQARVLTALAARLRTLPTSARRSGFAALATSIDRLPQAGRTIALPALTRALPASGKDAGQFHAVHARTLTLDTDAQGRTLPGLIRHLGVLPEGRRTAAFDAIARQVQTLPAHHQRNALCGLAGKIRKLPADQQAPATTRLQQQVSALLQS